MSENLDNMHVDWILLVAFVKYILSQIYSHWIWKCTFGYYLEIVETFVFWIKYFQNLPIFIFYPKTSNFRNSEMVGRRKLPDPSMKKIFLMFYWLIYNTRYHLNDLILPRVPCYNNAKRSVFRIQDLCTAWRFPISETGGNFNSLFKVVDSNRVTILEAKRERLTVR